jgi:hypothetical protein
VFRTRRAKLAEHRREVVLDAWPINTLEIYRAWPGAWPLLFNGSEWDFLLQKPFAKNFLCGIEYAVYKAKRNSSNVARNSASGQAFDLSKLWLYLQYRY